MRTHLISTIAIVSMAVGVGVQAKAQAGTWTTTGTTAEYRAHLAAAALPNGKAFVAGGLNVLGQVASAEIYDSATNAWSSAGSLPEPREGMKATTLQNGKVLVTGGANKIGYVTTSTVYDPATNTWSSAIPMRYAHYDHTATLLKDGRVLLVGGCNTIRSGYQMGVEIYDPATNTWSVAAADLALKPRDSATATLLGNGKVLLVGGSASPALYDPETDTWSPGGSGPVITDLHTATLLTNGKVLIEGGADRNWQLLTVAYTYDPDSNTWSEAGCPQEVGQNGRGASRLPDGRVMVAGGLKTDGLTPAVTEVYDPYANTWSIGTPLPSGRADAETITLSNGQILIAGGLNFTEGMVDKALVFTPVPAVESGTWTITGSLTQPRTLAASAALPDGKALLIGGSHFSDDLSSVEIFDPTTGIWSPTGGLNVGRCELKAVTLKDGRVLAVGGYSLQVSGSNGTAVFHKTTELYDPATNKWSLAAPMLQGHYLHTVTLLNDGRVLVAGGGIDDSQASTTECEIYNPGTNAWSRVADMAHSRSWATATLLADNKVLIVGGESSDGQGQPELYDPATDTWSSGGTTIGVQRYSHTATQLANGKVLITGGTAENQGYLASTEIYDPTTNTWSAAGNLSGGRVQHEASRLPDGKVMVVGGFMIEKAPFGGVTYAATTTEIYDPATNAWASGIPSPEPRAEAETICLPNGQVLIAGGLSGTVYYDYAGTALLYTPTVNPVNGNPTITTIANQTINENTPTAAIPFTIGDVETTAASLRLVGTSSNMTLIPVSSIVFGGSGANRTVTITPAANLYGTSDVRVRVIDANGGTTSSLFTITVNSVNSNPTITAIANQTIDENTPTAAIPFTIGDVETPAASMSLVGTSSNTTLIPVSNIVFGGSGADRTVTITPTANLYGTAYVRVRVNDASGGTNSALFSVTVNLVNNNPTITAIANQAINQNTATLAIPFSIGDVETPATSLTLVGTSSNPTLIPVSNIVFGGNGASRTVTITPVANQTGTSYVRVRVNDASGGTNSTLFLVTVNLVNNNPTITTVANQTINENTPTAAIPFTIGDVETTAANLSLVGTSSNTTLIPVSNIVFGGSGANRTVTITPAANLYGTAYVRVRVNDASGGTNSVLFSITVNPSQ